MDRSGEYYAQFSAGVPRMRGDGPQALASESREQVCSPHARGWTELRTRGM